MPSGTTTAFSPSSSARAKAKSKSETADCVEGCKKEAGEDGLDLDGDLEVELSDHGLENAREEDRKERGVREL